MDDDLHDLTPARRPAPDPGDAAAATAVRTALDAGRPPVDPERLLAGVQARATRCHRRRQAVTSLAAAVAVAGVITAGVALPGGAPSTGPRDGVPPAADGPSTTAPLPTASDPAASSSPPAAGPVTAASMLTLADVGEVIPDARGVEAAGPRPRAAGDPVTGGVCTDEVLPGVPEPSADLTALWTESGAGGLPASVREDLLSWDSAAGATQYAAASAAEGQACAAQSAAASAAASAAGGASETTGYRLLDPPTALSGGVLAVAQVSPRLWRVRVVAARGTVAVSLSANLRGPATTAGADAAAAKAAGLAVTALDRAAGP